MSFEVMACLVTLFLLAGIGTPIGYSIILAALVYLGLGGMDLALAGEKIIQGLYRSFVLLAVPLFIVAANIMNAGTISDRLLNFCVAAVGRFRGGLGHVNVVASLIFSGMSGSAVADAAGIGKIIIQMMTKDGRYGRGYAAAITAASATIGPIIPPSIPMVLYALVSQSSIGALFLAGIIPGLIMGVVLMAMNSYIAHKRGFVLEEPVPLRELPRKTANAFPALLMPVILLFGIYGGVTTPTEAAAIAALYALLLAGLFYRALSLRALYEIFVESARASAAVGVVIGGALILNFIVVSENIPSMVADALVGIDMSPTLFLLLVMLLVLLLGCVLDATTIILVIVPLFTPAYGILLFVINAVTGIPLREIIAEIWPFLIVLIGALLLLVFFPGLVLWLPHLLGYGG